MENTTHAPNVSVIIPSYNHERYVGECIQSVLNQTYQDFEIVITDDGSSDNTVKIIEGFDDARIKLFKHPKNKGACVAANNCIQHANGKYIAMLSSDDIWYPEKLEVQVEYLDMHPEIGVVFGKADWIDESSNLITNVFLPYFSLFNVNNRSRFEWLRHFFLVGNNLCHPCSLVRRECYSEVGMFNPAFASLPDLDLWIRICMKYDIWVLDEKLIQFRKFSNENNASGATLRTLIRNSFEHRHSLDHYLNIKDPNELFLVFPDAAKYGAVIPETIPYILGRIAINTDVDYKVLWGLDVIYKLLQDTRMAQVLENVYGFTYLDFIKLTSEYDIFKIAALSTIVSTVRRTPIKMFLSASKQYFKVLYMIVLNLFTNKSD